MALLSSIITPTNLVTANSNIALVNKTLTSPVITSPTGIVKGDVGLGNVDNTSDATKNAATATLTNKTLTSPVINTPTGIVKGDVGLGNVDNTSDATKNAASVTLTNKTIDYANNTLTGVAGVTATQTLTNKTLTAPVISTISNSGTLTLPTSTDTLVGRATTDTLTSKTLTNPTVTNYVETPYSANSSTAITLSLANGTVQIITLTGSATITMPTAVSGKSFTILLKQDATGSRTVTWSTVQWPSGTAPTITSTASKMDKYVFISDGTYWYGSNAGQNYTA